MKRIRWIAVVCCAAAFAVSANATYAWLFSRDEAVNTFYIGEDTIEIIEVYEPPPELEEGLVIVKQPWVKNTGSLPTFVRMRADFSSKEGRDLCEPLEIDDDNWEYNSADGFYYYKFLLLPGAQTPPLFRKVQIKEGKTPSEMVDFDIIVYAESYTHRDHSGTCPGDEYKDAWPDGIPVTTTTTTTATGWSTDITIEM